MLKTESDPARRPSRWRSVISGEEFAGLVSPPLERRSRFATLERECGIELHYPIGAQEFGLFPT